MPTYISSRDLKDVFPNLDEFDTKKPIYGWVVDSGSRFVAHDSGLVTQLFVDGKVKLTAFIFILCFVPRS